MPDRDPSISPNSYPDEESDEVIIGNTPGAAPTIFIPRYQSYRHYSIRGTIETAANLNSTDIGSSRCMAHILSLEESNSSEHDPVGIGSVYFNDGVSKSIALCKRCGNIYVNING